MSINKKDVITMKIPYPDINSQLAIQKHMYICCKKEKEHHGFDKVQTLKPYMINNPTFVNFVDEMADINRNPFAHQSRIDCEKIFTTTKIEYEDSIKTYKRPDVSNELFSKIKSKLSGYNYSIIPLDENVVVGLNSDKMKLIK